MKNNYKCEYPDCENTSKIRTKIKDRDSEFYGLRVCPKHAKELVPKKISDKTRRTQEARKEQRKDYPEFYQKHIEIARKKCCEECGGRLEGNANNIAHVIQKSTNPETATDDNNILYLCQNCHTRYDRNLRVRQEMQVMKLAIQRFKLLQIVNITAETLFFQERI